MSKIGDNIRGLFKRNSNQAQFPYGSGVNVWGGITTFGGVQAGKYADVYFYSIVNKIFNGLKNCRFIDQSDTLLVSTIKDFLEREITHIVWNYWKDGIVVVGKDRYGYSIIDDYKKDNFGRVVVPSNANYYVAYADIYKVKRLSAFQIIRNELGLIDKIGSATDFLTSTYGSVCILSGNTMPIGVAEKEDLNMQLKTSLGITADKSQFIISNSKDLKLEKVDFDIQGLALDDKLRQQYLLLADFFGVPKNILSSDTDSTYENQKAALKRFYSDCIAPLCEFVLQIGREIIIESRELVPASTLTYTFDNVPELNTDNEFIATIKGLLEVAGSDALDARSKRKINDIINAKIENYQ